MELQPLNSVNPQSPGDRPVYNDEIDLVDLCAKLWRGRWKVVIASIICLSLAVVYLYITPKTYKLETVLAPPMAGDLAPIQPPAADGRYTLPSIGSGQVYELLNGYLQSEEKQLGFWMAFHAITADNTLSEDARSGFLRFRNSLALSAGKKDDVALTVSLDTESPDEDVKLLADFISYTNRQVIENLVDRMEEVLVIQKGKLSEDIGRTRTQYQVQLQDQIARLQEDLAIATKNGIEETPYTQLANVELKVVDNRFLLGEKMLSAQLEALENRKDNDAFVPGLRNLQNQLERIEADLVTLNKYQADARAFVVLKPLSRPLAADSPKTLLVLVLSIVVGGILGLCWIMVASLVVAIRQRDIVSEL